MGVFFLIPLSPAVLVVVVVRDPAVLGRAAQFDPRGRHLRRQPGRQTRAGLQAWSHQSQQRPADPATEVPPGRDHQGAGGKQVKPDA